MVLPKALKPSDHAEQSLIHGILDGDFKAGDSLPPERILAARIGVTRPTLREALGRLHRDGWITIRHGRPTRVNDYLTEGGLNVLGAIAGSGRLLSERFVDGLLDVRCLLAPAYFGEAVRVNADEVVDFLEQGPAIDDGPDAFCRFDWELHHSMSVLSSNPVYPLMLNGFRDLYMELGRHYFEHEDCRRQSYEFYAILSRLAASGDKEEAVSVTRHAMEESRKQWLGMRGLS